MDELWQLLYSCFIVIFSIVQNQKEKMKKKKTNCGGDKRITGEVPFKCSVEWMNTKPSIHFHHWFIHILTIVSNGLMISCARSNNNNKRPYSQYKRGKRYIWIALHWIQRNTLIFNTNAKVNGIGSTIGWLKWNDGEFKIRKKNKASNIKLLSMHIISGGNWRRAIVPCLPYLDFLLLSNYSLKWIMIAHEHLFGGNCI